MLEGADINRRFGSVIFLTLTPDPSPTRGEGSLKA